MSDIEAVARWWLAFTIVSLAVAPVTWWMAAGLGKYRHALLRPVGLVVATFLVWWPAAVFGLPFRLEMVAVGLAIAGIAAWLWLVFRNSALASDVRRSARSLAVFELIWLVSFLGYCAFRASNPDIANTEKPMEIALLSSVVRSDDVPAPDPWFAGYAINYYYFGYQTVATLVHLSGVVSTTAFNLMLGSLFASTLTVASGLGAWLADRAGLSRAAVVASGALAAFFVGLAGNLETFVRLLQEPGQTISAGWWDGVGWQASRVITDTGINGNPAAVETINEFPAFSFVLGDLHPHLTTLPVLLTTIALAASLAGGPSRPSLLKYGGIGGFAGLLYASNSWDAPVGIVAVLGAILLAYRRFDRDSLTAMGAVIAGAIFATLPFAVSYTAPVGVGSSDVPEWFARIPVLGSLPDTIAVVTWRPSSASELLVVHGAWIMVASLFIFWSLLSADQVRNKLKPYVGVLLPAALILIAAAVAWSPALVLLGVPAAATLAIAVWDERRFVRLIAALYVAGFGLALVPEFVYIQDSFGNRMNTVFKLNFQAWIFFGVASGAAAVIAVWRSSSRLRTVALVAVPLAFIAVAPYTLLSAEDWMDLGVASGTLDGAAYLETTNPDEAAAIAWLDTQAEEGDVILEAPGCAYQSLNGVPMNRFSAFTGVPTPLGWANHERQWRRGEFDDLQTRIDARNNLADSWLRGEPGPTPSELAPRFVMFGTIERSTSERCPMLTDHGDETIEDLQALGWAVAFERGQTIILARAGDPSMAAGN